MSALSSDGRSVFDYCVLSSKTNADREKYKKWGRTTITKDMMIIKRILSAFWCFVWLVGDNSSSFQFVVTQTLLLLSLVAALPLSHHQHQL